MKKTAERRMFAKTIVLSDAFLDMSLGARCLYMTLGMVADDDGFVNNPRSIMRQCGASDDDMKILLAKKFVLLFDDGVIVIKHWRINNYLQSDRYRETKYTDHKKELTIEKNGAYTRSEDPCIHSNGIHNDGIPSIGKDSIGKDRLGERGDSHPTLEEVKRFVSENKLNVNAEKFFRYYEDGNWVDSKGNEVKNWKQKLRAWDSQAPENKGKSNFSTGSEVDYDELAQASMERLYAEYGETISIG